MAPSMRGTLVIVVLVVMTINLQAHAQSGCTSVLISLAPCLNYVSGSASTPSTSCCSQLATVVQSQPRCLCMLLNGGASSLGVTMNETLALALPAACKVETPPVSRCHDAAGPAMAPFFSPAASPTASSSESSSSQGSRANSMKKYLHFMTALTTLLVVTMGGSYA